jgi:hypothetical protein
VLQTESERLEKEKENIILRESISKLKRQLNEKDRELRMGAINVSEIKSVSFHHLRK